MARWGWQATRSPDTVNPEKNWELGTEAASRLLRLPFREPLRVGCGWRQQRAASSTSTRPSANSKQLLAARSSQLAAI